MKEEALDLTLWSTRFGWGYGPVVRQTIELICLLDRGRAILQIHSM
jgi:hypothetical protein